LSNASLGFAVSPHSSINHHLRALLAILPEHQSLREAEAGALHAPLAFMAGEHPPQADGGKHRGNQDHEDDGGEYPLGEERFPPQRQADANPGEDQADFAARNHPDANGQTVPASLANSEGAGQLPGQPTEYKDRPQKHDVAAREASYIDLNAHEDKKQGDEQSRQRVNQL
jgi:hypothetical protein